MKTAGFPSMFLSVAAILVAVSTVHGAEEWRSLFNGKDLDGWTPKIKGYALGENFADTFRVKDGALCVDYSGYTKFDNKFGHIYYKQPFSNYVFRLEYRFMGNQLEGGAGWATRNSGVMMHCQDPASIGLNQDFPVSIEVQFLGGDGKNTRTTGNLCTPGTHVVMKDQLHTQHCTNSKSQTYHGEQWVKAEIEAHSNKKIIHRINGETVLEYEYPQLDPNDNDAKKLIKGDDLMVYGGYISLQSESHPVQFRNIEIKELKE